MAEIDKSKPVLVTGATGYVAGWIVKRLLEDGMAVHAAVRDPSNVDKLKYLQDLAQQARGTIRFFKSDLLHKGSYATAMQDCELVYHTASPFVIAVKDVQKDLIDPARLGTQNVLDQANQTQSVKRVVVTSSCAAIYGDNCDLHSAAAEMFSEADWNSTSSLQHQAYSYSKTLAEREAWRRVEAQDRWDLVTINPSLVLGPGINPHATSESFTLFKQLGDGTMKSGVPDYGIGVVDVRDLAEAHLRAGYTSTAQGRYIVSGHNTTFLGIGRALHGQFGADYPIPRRTLPKWLIWLVGPIMNKVMTRRLISRNVGHPFKVDNRKGLRELGLTYRPMVQTACDMFQQMIDHGVLTQR